MSPSVNLGKPGGLPTVSARTPPFSSFSRSSHSPPFCSGPNGLLTVFLPTRRRRSSRVLDLLLVLPACSSALLSSPHHHCRLHGHATLIPRLCLAFSASLYPPTHRSIAHPPCPETHRRTPSWPCKPSSTVPSRALCADSTRTAVSLAILGYPPAPVLITYLLLLRPSLFSFSCWPFLLLLHLFIFANCLVQVEANTPVQQDSFLSGEANTTQPQP